MCSLWKTMEESDDGDLEAVVRGYSRMNPYNWQPASARFDPGLSFRSPGGLVFPNLMAMTAPASPVGMDLQDLCRPFYGDGNGSVLRSASSCSSLMFESMEVNTTSSSMFAAESSPAPAAVACIRKLGGIKEEKCSEILSSRVPEPRDVLGSKPVKVEPLKECDGSSSSLSQGVESGGTAQPVCKGQGSKRRKSQQKRIVCVPAAAGSNRPSGESLPSDLWAWRKYGQKPIKGSPYPRGYYRCSSSKGCSARKQVERSRTDPTMLVITYTSDHNHPWPTHRNALAGSTRQTPSEKNAPAESRAQKQENSETIIMPDGENNNNNNDSTTAAFSVAGGGCSISSADGENLSSGMIQDDQDPAAAAELRNLFRPEDDFFAELGELPEPLNIFARQNFDDDKSDEEEAASSVVDPFNLFNWSSLNPTPSPFVDTKTAM